jgi:hypothetical protein
MPKELGTYCKIARWGPYTSMITRPKSAANKQKEKLMSKLFHLSAHPCMGFIHEARFNGLLFLVILAIAVSVTVFALSKPK